MGIAEDPAGGFREAIALSTVRAAHFHRGVKHPSDADQGIESFLASLEYSTIADVALYARIL